MLLQLFLFNLFLAGLYVVLTGTPTFFNALVGFVIGFIVIRVYSLASGERSYSIRILRMIRFVVYFVYILIKANLEVAWEIITPGYTMTPRIIRYDVRGLTDVQVTFLANAITLTPGTLTADVSEATGYDPATGEVTHRSEYIYIHCMYAGDRPQAVAAIDELRDHLLRDVFGQMPPPEGSSAPASSPSSSVRP